MDQAARANQDFLRHHTEFGENGNLDCHQRLCARRHRQKTFGCQGVALHYSIIQILSLTLFEKTNLHQLLSDTALQILDPVDANQLRVIARRQ